MVYTWPAAFPHVFSPRSATAGFMRAFVAKGRMGKVLARVPVHVVTLRAALLGAALRGLELAASSAVIAGGR